MAGPFKEKFGFKTEIKSLVKAPSCICSANVCNAKAMYASSSGLDILLTLFHVFRKTKTSSYAGCIQGWVNQSVSYLHFATLWHLYFHLNPNINICGGSRPFCIKQNQSGMKNGLNQVVLASTFLTYVRKNLFILNSHTNVIRLL